MACEFFESVREHFQCLGNVEPVQIHYIFTPKKKMLEPHYIDKVFPLQNTPVNSRICSGRALFRSLNINSPARTCENKYVTVRVSQLLGILKTQRPGSGPGMPGILSILFAGFGPVLNTLSAQRHHVVYKLPRPTACKHKTCQWVATAFRIQNFFREINVETNLEHAREFFS